MDKKKILIVICICFLVIVAITFFVFKINKKDRSYDVLNESENKYWLLSIDDKYGVIRKDGKVLIEPEYDRIDIPNKDYGIFVTYKNDEKRILNENGKEILSSQDVSAIEGIGENDEEVIFDKSRLKYEENGKFGLIDFKGNKITDAEYNEIISLSGKNGEYRVEKDGKYGVLSNKGVELVKIKYDYVEGDGYIKDGNAKDAGYIVGLKDNNGINYGYIDKNEKTILKIEYESIYRVLDMPNEDVYLVASKNGRSKIYKDKKNQTEFLYREVSYFPSSNTFVVKKNKTYGLLNKDIKQIISPDYDEMLVAGMYVNASKDDELFVFDLNGKKIDTTEYIGLERTLTKNFYIAINEDSMYGILDENMEVVVPLEYDYIREVEGTDLLAASKGDSITIYSANMKELFSVENARMDIVNNHIKIVTDKDIVYFTMDGKKVDNMTVYLTNEIYAEKKNGKWGYVDAKGNVVVDYIYDKATEINEYGFAGIRKNGKWGVINEKGEVILKPTYESDAEEPSFIGEYAIIDNICTNIVY